MEGAAVEAIFSAVLTVAEDMQIGVATRVLTHQGHHIHHRALHKVLILIQEVILLKVPVTEGSRMAGIRILVDIMPTAMVIDMVITRTVRIEAILEVIHMVGMVDMVVEQVQEVDTVDTVDIQTKPVTLREVVTTGTREAEEESDELVL